MMNAILWGSLGVSLPAGQPASPTLQRSLQLMHILQHLVLHSSQSVRTNVIWDVTRLARWEIPHTKSFSIFLVQFWSSQVCTRRIFFAIFLFLLYFFQSFSKYFCIHFQRNCWVQGYEHFLSLFLLEYSCFTMLCLLGSSVQQNELTTHIHIFPLLGFPSHLGHHRALSRVPCAEQ